MSKAIAQRQRIGPQIRHLRQLRGLTLDDLAGSAGLSASHLSRLERSQTLPSFTVLANIAQVLDVSIDEFVQLEHDLKELDEQLAWQADLLALDENAYQEIVGLSIDTRRQLNHAIELLSNGQMSDVNVQEKLSNLFESEESHLKRDDRIRELIRTSGQNAIGLSRSWVQLTEIPGPRIGILNDAGLLASAPNVDYMVLYRGLFPGLPVDPSVARKWSRWYEEAHDEFPFDWPIKIIAHPELLTRIAKRFHKVNEIDGKDMVSRIAQYWKQMLSDSSQFQLAIAEDDYGQSNRLTAGNAAALFEHYETDHPNDQHQPVGLWTSGTPLVEPVVNRLMESWNKLSDRSTDPSVVGDWLEKHIR
ncbi:MAG: helix-turn-helix transcriptional regulator [Thermomicrobiaceae bacterium]